MQHNLYMQWAVSTAHLSTCHLIVCASDRCCAHQDVNAALLPGADWKNASACTSRMVRARSMQLRMGYPTLKYHFSHWYCEGCEQSFLWKYVHCAEGHFALFREVCVANADLLQSACDRETIIFTIACTMSQGYFVSFDFELSTLGKDSIRVGDVTGLAREALQRSQNEWSVNSKLIMKRQGENVVLLPQMILWRRDEKNQKRRRVQAIGALHARALSATWRCLPLRPFLCVYGGL